MYKIIFTILIVFMLNSCAFNITGYYSQNSQAKKYTIKEEAPVQEVILEENNDTEVQEPPLKDCNQTIKELKDQYVKFEIEILSLETQRRKLAGEINYYQASIYEQDKYQQKVEELDEVTDRYNEVKSKLAKQKDAIKILADKCKIKVRLNRD